MPDVIESSSSTPAAPAEASTPAPGSPPAPEAKPDAKPESSEGSAPAPKLDDLKPKVDGEPVRDEKGRFTGEKRRYRVKVEGEEMEVDEDELVKDYQLRRASYQRMEQTAALKKQLEGFVESFKKDPVSTMKQLAEGNTDFDAAVEKYLYEKLSREKMDPKERALLEAQEKLRAAEEEKKTWAEKQRQAKVEKERGYWQQKYDEDITAALADPEVGLPKTAATVSRMAQLLAKAVRANIPVDARDVARLVKEEYIASQRELLGKLSGEQLLKALGPDIAQRIREHEVEQLKRRSAPAAPPAPPKEPPKKEERQPAFRTPREFDEYLKSLK